MDMADMSMADMPGMSMPADSDDGSSGSHSDCSLPWSAGECQSMTSCAPSPMRVEQATAIATVVILNTILLWNEFLYAVVLIVDDAKRTLPLGIQKFMGDQLEDYGMIATGLMIAIVPVVLIYVFFSEKLIQGMTAGAVK